MDDERDGIRANRRILAACAIGSECNADFWDREETHRAGGAQCRAGVNKRGVLKAQGEIVQIVIRVDNNDLDARSAHHKGVVQEQSCLFIWVAVPLPSTQRRDEFQTDALRPGALPSASLRVRAGEEQTIEQSSDEYLDNMYEDWNKKVDQEIDTLVEGMTELVKIAAIGNKDKFRVAQEAFEAQCRTESMVRAATSLLSITHSLKLLLLLSDESEIASRRDRAVTDFERTADNSRVRAAGALDAVLNSDL